MLGARGTWHLAAAALEKLGGMMATVSQGSLQCGWVCSSIFLLSLHSSADRDFSVA